jgi:predicted DNA-binding ribbon-helix-helix protein
MAIVKRSVMIAGRRTSITLEDAFWMGLKEIAAKHDTSVQNVVSAVRNGRSPPNLSSALRLFVLEYYRSDGGEKARVGWSPAAAAYRGTDPDPATNSPPSSPANGGTK